MRQKLSFDGLFSRGDEGLPFRYVPFEMPSGAQRLEVSYHFEAPTAPAQPGRESQQDIVDIGVFDARGAAFLEGGFRGWSGSSRSQFFISPSEATPGYVRGPLPTGEWNLLLGCPLLRREQMRYSVRINIDVDLDADDPATPETMPAPRTATRRSGPGRWYRGDFHSHTVHSDGYNTIDEYVVEAKRVGLDFLAITDHNTISHFEEIAQRPERDGLLLLPGEEVTTFWGHANVWGLDGWVDFRFRDDASAQQVLEWVHERGGLFSPNHPKPSAGYPWTFDQTKGFRVVEAWQGAWRWHNEESLEFWEERLRNGEQVVAVGGSDCHSIPPAVTQQPWTVGNPCTWTYVQGALDEAGVLDAVRKGHVFVSEDTTGPYLELTASCGGETYQMGDTIEAPEGTPVRYSVRYRGPSEKKLRFVRDSELWQEFVADKEDTTVEFEAPLDAPGYVRVEAAGFRGRPERGEVIHALTNPLYVRVVR
ncbi:MAG: CehA/McbA family metallohydrolase [Dehalococcoidia bacterium]